MLALLNVESHTDLSNNGLGVGINLETSDDLLNVFELLGIRDGSQLTKAS